MSPVESVVVGVMVATIALLVTLLVDALLLSAARGAVRLWVRGYTRGLDAEVQERRRLEVESYVYEQCRAAKEEGHAPRAVAVQLILGWLGGVPADLSWRSERREVSRLSDIPDPELRELLIHRERVGALDSLMGLGLGLIAVLLWMQQAGLNLPFVVVLLIELAAIPILAASIYVGRLYTRGTRALVRHLAAVGRAG